MGRRVNILIIFLLLQVHFATGVIDTRGKFTTGVNDTSNTGGKLTVVSLIPLANLPLELLIPVVHIDLRISRKFLKKFKMTLMLFLGAWKENS